VSAADAVAEGRTQAELLMFDACIVDRPGPVVTDSDSGVVAPSMSRIYPTPEELAAGNPGKCKVQQTSAQSSNPTAGGHSFTVQSTRWDTPISAGPFAVNDVVTMTGAVLDPQLVGRVYRVVELFHKSGATAQRVRVEEVSA
jgi:hypothetical protein